MYGKWYQNYQEKITKEGRRKDHIQGQSQEHEDQESYGLPSLSNHEPEVILNESESVSARPDDKVGHLEDREKSGIEKIVEVEVAEKAKSKENSQVAGNKNEEDNLSNMSWQDETKDFGQKMSTQQNLQSRKSGSSKKTGEESRLDLNEKEVN